MSGHTESRDTFRLAYHSTLLQDTCSVNCIGLPFEKHNWLQSKTPGMTLHMHLMPWAAKFSADGAFIE